MVALNYYVYYRVARGSEDAARRAVTQMLGRISDDTGVQGRLLTKRQEPDLWMEAYDGVRDGGAFERALKAHTTALGLPQYLVQSQRHIECFEG